MSDWHHHHGDHRIVFCQTDSDECTEEYDGLICNDGDRLWDEKRQEWVLCRYHLAFGDYVLDVGEPLALFTHLALVPEPEGI